MEHSDETKIKMSRQKAADVEEVAVSLEIEHREGRLSPFIIYNTLVFGKEKNYGISMNDPRLEDPQLLLSFTNMKKFYISLWNDPFDYRQLETLLRDILPRLPIEHLTIDGGPSRKSGGIFSVDLIDIADYDIKTMTRDICICSAYVDTKKLPPLAKVSLHNCRKNCGLL